MKKIDSFINQFSLSKTLQFKLIPVGNTLKNFTVRNFLAQDVARAEAYELVRGYMDDYHRFFIDAALAQIRVIDVQDYANLYYKKEKTDTEKRQLKANEEKLRKSIAAALTSHPNYKKMFGREMITELLPVFLTEEEHRSVVAEFDRFTTYFTGFYENRKNMYTYEEKATGIAYRCINDNLPKFLDNANSFPMVFSQLPQENIQTLNEDFAGLLGHTPDEAFLLENFARVLTQHGISRYNEIIGGYTLTDGTKVQGLNEYINRYNQVHEKPERLPQMKMLFKQILSDRSTVSFIPDKFNNDNEVIVAVRNFFEIITTPVTGVAERLGTLFSELDTYDQLGVYVKAGPAITEFSNQMFGSWHTLRDTWNAEYDAAYIGKSRKNLEKYVQGQDKTWKRVKSFSLAELQHIADIQPEPVTQTVVGHYKNVILTRLQEIRQMHTLASGLLSAPYANKPKRLAKNDDDIALLKNLLDSLKTLEWSLKPLLGDGSEENRDAVFYSEFEDCYHQLHQLDRLYDKVRNYITQKPYSKDKIKLNFENPRLLSGWDKNKERDYRTVLLRKDGLYYLAVMDKSDSKIFMDYPSENSEGWEKIDYKLLPGPNKMLPKVFFAKSNLEFFAPSEQVLKIYREETFKKGDSFNVADCHELIAFYQESIARHPDWGEFGFQFKPAVEYADISEFYKDVELQGYKIQYHPISADYLNEKIDAGALYLFQIYSKDFSPYSKGTPNLHTLYFKMLFDERNLENVVFQLNGGAEMFYRFPSIKEDERILHPKNCPIKNKKPHTGKTHSCFDYDLVKDKRFTEPQFSLHLPIKLNFKAIGNERINYAVRKTLKACARNYIIGIDRGERHLVYITVIDDTGKIVEQFSGNQIINSYNGKQHTTDYHQLLDRKEKERLKARQNWNAIESIKDLKEGYVSQIVHKVCELVIKYDAVIAMANLNSGFKNSRLKVEKQVYQKFEKMLIDKMNFLVDKQRDPDSNGGLLHAYQLTEKFENFEKTGSQNGFIFYVPAWLTSKIDPTTGFVDLLKPKYANVSETKQFIKAFKQIRYNEAENMFELSFDYHDFPKGSTDAKGEWTVCTNADRIETHRDEKENGNYVSTRVILTDEWISLFESAGIDYRSGDLRSAMLQQTEKAFFDRFIHLLRLTLQMRNSVTGTDEDYLISPVRNATGSFYDSRSYNDKSELPCNADANGAFNIARKAAWAISVLKATPDEDLQRVNFAITNKAWLEYTQMP